MPHPQANAWAQASRPSSCPNPATSAERRRGSTAAIYELKSCSSRSLTLPRVARPPFARQGRPEDLGIQHKQFDRDSRPGPSRPLRLHRHTAAIGEAKRCELRARAQEFRRTGRSSRPETGPTKVGRVFASCSFAWSSRSWRGVLRGRRSHARWSCHTGAIDLCRNCGMRLLRRTILAGLVS